jgi:hypothetical protein
VEDFFPFAIALVPAAGAVVAAIIARRYANKAQSAQAQEARIRDLEERLSKLREDVYTPMLELFRQVLDSANWWPRVRGDRGWRSWTAARSRVSRFRASFSSRWVGSTQLVATWVCRRHCRRSCGGDRRRDLQLLARTQVWKRIIQHLPFSNRFKKNLDKARELFRERGGREIFIGRYISVVGTFIPFAAGTSKMPFKTFLLFDVIALVFWAVGITLLGYFLNSQIHLVDQILSRFGWGLLALTLLYLGGRALWKRRDGIGRSLSPFASSKKASAKGRS